MRLLLDQDVYASTARFLRSLGHDVITVAQIGLSEAEDSELLERASDQDRILVTRDRDFGNLVFAQQLGTGVLYLRVLPSTQGAVHEELESVLTTYDEATLQNGFVVGGTPWPSVQESGENLTPLPRPTIPAAT